MKWYIEVMKAGMDKDNAYRQFEVVKLGPFTEKQLPDMLIKITYQPIGAIRIRRSPY